MFDAAFWRHLQSFQRFLQPWLRQHRTGLLLLLLGVCLPLQIFGALAEDVWEHQGGSPWDVPLLLAIHATANPQLDALRLLMRAKLEAMTQAVIASIVGWRSILDALSVAGL